MRKLKEPEFDKEKFNRDFDERMRQVREKITENSQKASQIEDLLAKEGERGTKTVLYALRAVLIELANASEVHVDAARVAGAFYREAAHQAGDWADPGVQRCFRHIDVLLRNPDARTGRRIANYWDDGRMNAPDPFPAVDNLGTPAPMADAESITKVTPPRKRRARRDQLVPDETIRDLKNDLVEKLAKLERLPELELERFKLETEIYRLEHNCLQLETDEWPDVIRGGDNAL